MIDEKRIIDEKRLHKRVHLPRLATVVCGDADHPAFVEDISLGGVQLRNADAEEQFDRHFRVGDTVEIEIEHLSPLTGSVIRVADPMLAINFPDRDAGAEKAMMAEIMERQGLFGVSDPDRYRDVS